MKRIIFKFRILTYPFIVLIMILLNTSSAFSQTIKQITINYVEVKTMPEQYTNQVLAYVTVSSNKDTPVSGLLKDNFTAFEDGRPVFINFVKIIQNYQ